MDTIILQGYRCKLFITKKDDNYQLEFLCNINGDIGDTVSYDFGHDDASWIEPCFGSTHIVQMYDEEHNLEVEFGAALGENTEIYFELIDYNADYEPIRETNYKVKVDKNRREYSTINTIFERIKEHESKKGSESYEYKFNSIKH